MGNNNHLTDRLVNSVMNSPSALVEKVIDIDFLKNHISQHLFSKITLNSFDFTDQYIATMYLLQKWLPKKFDDYAAIAETNGTPDMMPGSTLTIYVKRYDVIIVFMKKIVESNYGGGHMLMGQLDIYFFGKKKNRIAAKNHLIELITSWKNPESINLKTTFHWGFQAPIVTKNDIVLPEGQLERITRSLKKWESEKEWYREHHMIHKIGVLLYGSPGCGKSTLVRYFSHLFNNAPITIFNKRIANNNTSNDDMGGEVANILQRSSGVKIFLIEDIDLFIGKRETNSEEANYLQNVLFQILDGVFSVEDTIYVATTNCIDELDPGLIRAGRFDIREEFKYFEKTEAIRYVKSFGYNEAILDEIGIDSYPISPAVLRARLMDYRAMN